MRGVPLSMEMNLERYTLLELDCFIRPSETPDSVSWEWLIVIIWPSSITPLILPKHRRVDADSVGMTSDTCPMALKKAHSLVWGQLSINTSTLTLTCCQLELWCRGLLQSHCAQSLEFHVSFDWINQAASARFRSAIEAHWGLKAKSKYRLKLPPSIWLHNFV